MPTGFNGLKGARPDPVQVLVIEDVDAMRHLLEVMLSGIPGVKVSGMAKNVWEAKIELSRRRPHLVVMDEVLPGESSADLLLELLALQLPVILVSSMEEPEHSLPPGAHSRLAKPGWKSMEQDRRRFQDAIISLFGLG